jgi:hypothetical protein
MDTCNYVIIIKNPPTLHSTSKIQPTTSPTFVFSVFESVRKTWGYEIKLLTVVLVEFIVFFKFFEALNERTL